MSHIIFCKAPSRRDCLGGTGISAILNKNKWTTREQLFDYYMALTDGPKENNFMEWGKRLEDPVDIKYCDFNDEVTMDPVVEAEADLLPGHMCIHPEHHFLVGSPDRLVRKNARYKVKNHKLGLEVTGIKHGLEIKTAYFFSKRNWEKKGIPEQYLIQCQFYMLITGLDKWDMAVLHCGTADYEQFTYEADPILHTEMVVEAKKFWKEVQDARKKKEE